MKVKQIGLSTKTVVILTLLLIVVEIIIGAALTGQSRYAMKALIKDHMLGVAESAAAMLDGNVLASLTEEDAGGEKQAAIFNMLNSFSDNLDFKYIYIVRPDGNGNYIFVADPDPVDPADFGEQIVSSPALTSAGKGTAAVDDIAVSDDWGKLYTAYCPIFTSDGKIGGIVGVDFDAVWYDNQMAKNTVYLLLSGIISLIIGGGIILLLTARLRRRFDKLNVEMTSLAKDLNTLTDEIGAESGFSLTASEANLLSCQNREANENSGDVADSIEKLSDEIKTIKMNLKQYITFVRNQAFTDTMTGVGSRTAYFELIHELNEKIKNGNASFSLAVFDINGLKKVNDDYGHETGDKVITGVAKCIKQVFAPNNVFRIGGDEFIAVIQDFSYDEMISAFEKLDQVTERENASLPPAENAVISFSKGAASFIPGQDTEFREVFKRADEQMYIFKENYYDQKETCSAGN